MIVNTSPDGGEMLGADSSSELGKSMAAMSLWVGLLASVFAVVIAVYAVVNDRVAVGLWIGGIAVFLIIAFGAALRYRSK
ncbi:hypothetical protein ACIF8T_23070 [Streptomyces sp. NPDC085946]|uniref:hypothetical protein n=1 Tax=Streptomyces sp. NPDC085946 TaxID=3365744 RepID=UPI0037D3AC89